MPVGSFEQLIGAAGDVKELEYVSALHQTDCDELRRDCSIKAEDIRMFLSSRYGIVVDNDTVHSVILSGLGGANADSFTQKDEEEVLDLMEIVALLVIPTLLKARLQEFDEELPEGVIKTPPGMLEYVLKMILHDTTGNSAPKPLTKDLLKCILLSYGEGSLANNEALIESMLAATDGAQVLDTTAFAEALTADVRLYDIENEARLTTLYEDVFVSRKDMELPFRRSKMERPQAPNVEAGDQEKGTTVNNVNLSIKRKEATVQNEPFKRRWMAASIDVTADLYRSKTLVVCLWCTILIWYFGYIWLGGRIVPSVGEGDCVCRALFNYSYSGSYQENADVMFCQLGHQVANWLAIFAFLCFIGTTVVTVGSIGNYVGSPFWQPLIGTLCILLFVIIPFKTEVIDTPPDSNSTVVDDDNVADDFVVDECRNSVRASSRGSVETKYLITCSLILGIVTASFHLFHVFSILVPRSCLKNMPWLKDRLATSNMFGEMHTKQAGSYKLAQMTRNALEIVRVNEEGRTTLNTHFAQALGEFAKSGRKYRTVGGFWWTCKRIWSKEVHVKDGIWLSTRMISSNLAQWIVCIYVLFRGIKLTMEITADYDNQDTMQAVLNWTDFVIDKSVNESLVAATADKTTSIIGQYLANSTNTSSFDCPPGSATELLNSYCTPVGGGYACNPGPEWTPFCALLTDTSQLDPSQTVALLQSSGLDVNQVESATRAAMQQATTQTVDNLYPNESYMVTVPLALATTVAFSTAVYLALAYIPSVCKTFLMLRCGAIKTMRDPNFVRYRVAADQVSILTGSLFWGAFFSSLVVGTIIGLVAFFFLWQGTLYFAQRAIALFVGFIVITLVRISLVCMCRCTLYKAFYRRRPALANFMLLALEWANFALSAGFVFVRMIKLLLAAATCIGRIDRPFLAPGVGRFGPIELDNYPMVHTKDILSHEAHRHPYIEILGVLYLMKLRYGENFGNSAGSTWRLLFVYALFPWLHEYRVVARPELLKSHKGGLTDLGQVSTMKLDFKSLRHVVLDDADDDEDQQDLIVNSNPPSVMRNLSSDLSSFDNAESTSAKESAAGVLCGSLAAGLLDPGQSDVAEDRMRQLEGEVIRLKKELEDARKNELGEKIAL